ncbi:MAG: hypothetical protein AVDCRST_MAG18-362 [uncultured Thermomicrobiales bacterium]|uniref:Uncharacterized protein n=1 Tax=uncultured Thermomicrobiales bacterium TaxID=1645740 RepID=A0A6J4ULV8_9BACT|nr:MAG: hypothetical protein AVDCRST_MAG18-362 [uncultured Thermomicrobiales bacterium]
MAGGGSASPADRPALFSGARSAERIEEWGKRRLRVLPPGNHGGEAQGDTRAGVIP